MYFSTTQKLSKLQLIFGESLIVPYVNIRCCMYCVLFIQDSKIRTDVQVSKVRNQIFSSTYEFFFLNRELQITGVKMDFNFIMGKELKQRNSERQQTSRQPKSLIARRTTSQLPLAREVSTDGP